MSETISRGEFLAAIAFNADGLVPAIAQDAKTGDVLMLAWMNRESLEKTLATGDVTYWSRSRNELWTKGATSSHTQKLVEAFVDCDGDTLLLKVDQTGPACHTGNPVCFYRKLDR
jgi:phosphoribosyl-AMP cyclohydrolase